MKRYWKEFLLRGMMFGGFGPVILAVVYYIINKTGVQTFTPPSDKQKDWVLVIDVK